MKVCIIYFSKTGVTKKLSYIAKERIEAEIVDVKTIHELDSETTSKYDLIIIGSYCDSDNYPKKVRTKFELIKKCKRIASFVTHATFESGIYYDKWAAGCEKAFTNFCMENGLSNFGYFHCRSRPSTAIALFIKLQVITNKEDWLEYKRDMYNYPKEEQIKRFNTFIDIINVNLGSSAKCNGDPDP